MRRPPLGPPGPSGELLVGPRSVSPSGGGACEHRHWGRGWGPSLEPRNHVMGGKTHANTASVALGG
eukprot:8648195-Pyramimonas_sp.AAC.1